MKTLSKLYLEQIKEEKDPNRRKVLMIGQETAVAVESVLFANDEWKDSGLTAMTMITAAIDSIFVPHISIALDEILEHKNREQSIGDVMKVLFLLDELKNTAAGLEESILGNPAFMAVKATWYADYMKMKKGQK